MTKKKLEEYYLCFKCLRLIPVDFVIKSVAPVLVIFKENDRRYLCAVCEKEWMDSPWEGKHFDINRFNGIIDLTKEFK